MLLRNTPRKRLSLGDTSESQFTTPEKQKRPQSALISNRSEIRYKGHLINGLRGLSHGQLVQLIMDLVAMQEDGALSEDEKLQSVLLKKMPVADIQPLIDTLNKLKHNIHASMACASDESINKYVYIHLDAFQVQLLNLPFYLFYVF